MHHAIKRGLVILTVSVLVAACGGGRSTSSGAGIPLVEPPVTKATPSGLVSSLLSASNVSGFRLFTSGLDIDEVKSRFFSTGPTTISELLKSIDTRIAEINSRSTESTHSCLSGSVESDAITIFGATVDAEFQCYDLFGSSGGMMFGRSNSAILNLPTDEGTWYLYQNVGQGRSLSKITPVTAGSTDYVVESWLSVGQGNSTDTTTCSGNWYGCSYGVIHLRADSSAKTFEMTAAGTGLGYCGVHLMSDGTNLYLKGSAGGYSSGSWNCATANDLCGTASAPGTAGSCGSINETKFTLTTLGVTGYSTFGADVTLNGTSTDSVHFGRSVDELSTLSGVSAF